jgi:hypothetical protein
MSDLITWLLAQLDKDTQLVNDCENEVGAERKGEPYSDGSAIADRDSYPSYPWGSQASELAFMKEFHPRRIRDEIAAKRRIVERYQRARTGSDPAYTEASLDAVLDLADIYTSREGYRDEWESQ